MSGPREWKRVNAQSRSSVMNRTIAASLLALGVVVRYAGHGVRTEAQASRFTEFPFTAGERVSVAPVGVEDRGIETCDIQGFAGDFVLCKGVAEDQPCRHRHGTAYPELARRE